MKAADWVWFVPVVAASVLTYVGATIGITGSVPDRLRIVPTFLAQIAASFAGTLAPASVGGLALNVRYLQKTGVDPAVAVPAVGLNAVAGIGVHILLLVLFLVWAGKSAFGSIHLPDPAVLLYGAAAVVVLAVDRVRDPVGSPPAARAPGAGAAALARAGCGRCCAARSTSRS